jgi:gluconolactonase
VAGLNRTRAGAPDGYTGGWIERVDLATGKSERLYDSCDGERLRGPNDIVFDADGGFYFTDFGKTWPRHRDLGGVYYARADGSKIVALSPPAVAPNGVGLSPDGKVVYAAETETGRLWAFDLEAPGRAKKHPFPSPHGGRLVCGLPGFQRLDSMALEASGNVCVATLMTGYITVITPNGRVLRQVEMPDPITTNICFGGPDLKTAYITLSGTGQLVAMDWPEPGLRLNYQ